MKQRRILNFERKGKSVDGEEGGGELRMIRRERKPIVEREYVGWGYPPC